MKLYWNKGILWIVVAPYHSIPINAYEALELLDKMQQIRSEIVDQYNKDILELQDTLFLVRLDNEKTNNV